MPNRHYLPKTLLSLWAAEDGRISRLSSRGELERHYPKYIGYIKDGHKFEGNGPWTHDFEHIFDPSDNIMADTFLQISNRRSLVKAALGSLKRRIEDVECDTQIFDRLAQCIASLIARSPLARRQMTSAARRWNGGKEIEDEEHQRNIIILNMRNYFFEVESQLKSGGTYLIMFSDRDEFILGEGFLSDIDETIGSKRCFVPLMPLMALAYIKPFPFKPQRVMRGIQLTSSEVANCNYISQVYTKDFIYFRGKPPSIVPPFLENKYLRYEEGRCPWLEHVLGEAL